MIQLRRIQQDQKLRSSDDAASVQLLVDGKPFGETGKLKFSDVTVNPTTGTVLLRLLFPNANHEILPGMFVHARLTQWKDDQAILVSQKSVTRKPDGSVSVWVVGTDGKANPRAITVTEIVGDKWIVSSGLKAGEKVVLEGIMKIQPGMQVKCIEATNKPIAAK
jgi:membrane fusion protein (multidrug efflux system)